MRRSLLTTVILLTGTVGAAEPTVPSAVIVAPTDGSVTVTSSTKPAPAPRRTLSPDTVAKLSAASPKYVPVAEKTETPSTAETAPVQREPDKPRNQIIRLPRFVVGEPRVHGPAKEIEVLTPKGRVDLALHRYPGLKFGPLAWLNNSIALEMLEEDLQVQRRREEANLWSLYQIPEMPGDRVVGK